MKDQEKEDAIVILEDIKATYFDDRFIQERLGTAIKLLKKRGTQHFWHIPTKPKTKLKKPKTAITITTFK